ncbi:MAG: cell wall-binding repeat-containing protein, partial [Actinomycetota bacterium]|nr:cell wall-binding repeat-containing protein [Actinomycetota bacterium]
ATVRLDKVAPLVTLIPEDGIESGGWILPTPDHWVMATATDNLGGTPTVFMSVNGGPLMSGPGAWGVPLIGTGWRSVAYFAVDEAGNSSAWGTYECGLDPFGPTTQIITPPPIWHDEPPVVTAIGHSFFAPLSSVRLEIEGLGVAGGGSPITRPVTVEGTIEMTATALNVAVIGNGMGGYVPTPSGLPSLATVLVDMTAPVTNVIAPAGWQQGSADVVLLPTNPSGAADGTCSDLFLTFYRLGDDPSPRVYGGPIHITDPGKTVVTYWSTDFAGNTEAEQSVSVFVDADAPVLSDDAPAAWQTAGATVTVDATDPHSGLASLDWVRTEPGGASSVGTSSVVPMPFAITTEGTTTIEYSAIDNAGNRCATETVHVRLDKTDPVTTDDAPTEWVSTDVTVTLTPSDPISGVAATRYRIGAGAPQDYVAPVAVTAEGVTNITYWSVDVAGNTEEPNTATVRIDRTGPVVSSDATPGWQRGPVTVTFTGADAGVGGVVFHYSLDGAAEATAVASIEITDTGVHKLAYYGVDALGNGGATVHTTLRFDDTAPVSASDIDEAWQQGPIDATITATDAHSGVTSIDATLTDPASTSTTRTAASDTMTFTLNAEGTTTVEFHATDAVGNGDSPALQMVRIDNTAPTMSLTPADTTAIDSIAFAIGSRDTLSGVAQVWCSLDGQTAEETDAVTIDTVGDHTIEYWAVDLAGNESAHEVHSVRVSPSLTDYVGVAGADRYQTAIAASQHSFPEGSNAVIIATGSNWPDALGGAALAGVYDAPVLLTRPDALSAEVAAEIVRLDPNHIFVLGGTAVVSEAVEADIRSLIVPTASLERFWGTDRFATSNVIAHRVVRDSAAFGGTAFVATGHSFPDALAAAPLATALERPLYLAGKNGLATATLEAMLDSGVTDVVILGGDAAVPAGVEAQLDGAAIAHVRVAGGNRYATAINIATHGVAAGMTWDKSALACGTAFPDALSGGVMQGHDNAVIMLARADALDAGVAATLEAQRDIIGEFRFMGGATAVSRTVRDEVKLLLR